MGDAAHTDVLVMEGMEGQELRKCWPRRLQARHPLPLCLLITSDSLPALSRCLFLPPHREVDLKILPEALAKEAADEACIAFCAL